MYNIEICTVEKNPNGYGELYGSPSLLSDKDKIEFTFKECIRAINTFGKMRAAPSAFIFMIERDGVLYRAQIKTA